MKSVVTKNKVVFCFHTNDHEYNLGIGFISSFLKSHHHETGVVIFREIDGKQLDTPESIAARIVAASPTVVGFSVMTFNWHRIKLVLMQLREIGYRGLIVVGGYHAILDTDDVVNTDEVDAVCTGEGELPMLELLDQYDGDNLESLSVTGMIIKANSSPSGHTGPWLVEDLDCYPYIDYDLFSDEGDTALADKFIGTFSAGGVYSLAVISGRGCPYKCSYCSNSALIDYYGGSKKFLRKFSPAKAVGYIKQTVERHRPEFIEFLDETFATKKSWMEEFCSLYTKEVGLPFSIMNRIDNLDEDTVEILVHAGLKVVLFGLESGDEDYREKYLNRKMTNRAIVKGAELLRQYGVRILTFNMFGMPFETEENVAKTFTLNEQVAPDVAIPFIYQPFPKTRLGDLAQQHGMVSHLPDGRWDYCSPSLNTGTLSNTRVVELVDDFRAHFCREEQVLSFYSALKDLCQPAA